MPVTSIGRPLRCCGTPSTRSPRARSPRARRQRDERHHTRHLVSNDSTRRPRSAASWSRAARGDAEDVCAANRCGSVVDGRKCTCVASFSALPARRSDRRRGPAGRCDLARPVPQAPARRGRVAPTNRCTAIDAAAKAGNPMYERASIVGGCRSRGSRYRPRSAWTFALESGRQFERCGTGACRSWPAWARRRRSLASGL
jgi:hypothetical protein